MVRGSHGSIVVGVDGSQDAITALAWAMRHAQVAGFAVCVLHAWLPDDPRYDGSSGPVGYGQRLLRDRAMTELEARERVHRAMAAAASWVPIGRSLVTQLVVRGEPGAVLVDMSTDGAQLVVGATGTGALPGILTPTLGSTTRYVLRHSWCPVTVVPSARLRGDLVTEQAAGGTAAPSYGDVPPARTPGYGS